MKKVLILTMLIVLTASTVFASSGKIIQLNNDYSTVIDVSTIQQMNLDRSRIVLKFSYSTRYEFFYYASRKAAYNDYQRLIMEVKAHAKNECLKNGGGKACYTKYRED